MATTIKLKNGSGAPLAGDLVQGEPALDLTNKRLYTEDSGGTVIEVGTNPSTLTVDTTTLVVDAGNNRVGVGTASPDSLLHLHNTSQNSYIHMSGGGSLGETYGGFIRGYGVSGQGGNLDLGVIDNALKKTGIKITPQANEILFNTAATERMRIDASGNVGIGTTSNIAGVGLELKKSGSYIGLNTTTVGYSLLRGYDNGTERWAIGQIGFGGADGFAVYTGTANTERMRIDSSGNVGIGTASPTTKLDVFGKQRIYLNNTSVGNASSMQLTQDGTGDAAISFLIGATTEWLAGVDNSDSDSFKISNITGGGDFTSTGMTLTTAGNVGIGTTSPAYKLDVLGSVRLKTGATGTPVIVSTGGDSQGTLRFGSASTEYSINSGADYLAMIFNTNGSEAMRIDSSGNLLVGTTSATVSNEGFRVLPSGSSGAMQTDIFNDSGGTALAVGRGGSDGACAIWKRGSTTVGSVSVTATTTTYNTTSDQRLKENIVDAPAGNIDAIRVRSFDWKVDGSHQTYGMVAQELVEVAPEAVSQGETEEDMWSIDYSKLVPMMIKEIQDLKAEVAALKGA